jgi:ribosomal protein L10
LAPSAKPIARHVSTQQNLLPPDGVSVAVVLGDPAEATRRGNLAIRWLLKRLLLSVVSAAVLAALVALSVRLHQNATSWKSTIRIDGTETTAIVTMVNDDSGKNENDTIEVAVGADKSDAEINGVVNIDQYFVGDTIIVWVDPED